VKERKRYVLVGTGVRAPEMFIKPILNQYKQTSEITAICDVNHKRMQAANKISESNLRMYTDFDQMLLQETPDAVIVCSTDSMHAHFIVKSLLAGCDVVTEKPMTIDQEGCRQILRAQNRSGKKVTVTFNYRYSPHRSKVKELILQGAIGKPLAVDLHWYLDTKHGADYFRRWHSNKSKSGGLMVHKATHHFDLVNWYLDQEPRTVSAQGALNHYGLNGQFRGKRCLTCDHKKTCQFFFDIKGDETVKSLYLDCEDDGNGYIRDRCVFRDDINIEDTMAVTVGYSRGGMLSYSLQAFSPYEGYRLHITGTEGRIEMFDLGTPTWDYDGSKQEIHVIRQFEKRKTYTIDMSYDGGHGGGDTHLLDAIFLENNDDPLGCAASSWDGAISVMTGVAANKSIKTGQAVNVGQLLDKIKPEPVRETEPAIV
jgi:predicted dehydrogenase